VAVVNDFVCFLRTQYEVETPAANGNLASFERDVAGRRPGAAIDLT